MFFFNVWTNFKYPVVFGGAKSLDPAKKKNLEEAVSLLATYLTGQSYAAGDHLTIADLSLLASATTMEVKAYINIYSATLTHR